MEKKRTAIRSADGNGIGGRQVAERLTGNTR